MALHRSEWLDACKRVPVGQTRRVRHGAESRSNMVLYNNPDSWSAWCHSCHEGGRVNKELLEPVDTSVPVYRKYLNTRDLVPFSAMDKQKYREMVLMLHSKGMSTAVLAKHNCFYNTVDERLVLRFDGIDIGRDLTGKSPAKWLHYDRDNQAEYVYLKGKIVGSMEPVILTEDLFSTIKINHYTGYSALCCLGTRISDEIIRFISSSPTIGLQHGKSRQIQRLAVAAFDGDLAGNGAERSLRSRLSIRGLPVASVCIPSGLDPKDMRPSELNSIFKILETSNVTTTCSSSSNSSTS